MSTEHLKRKLDGLKGKITIFGFLYGIGIFLAFMAGAFLVLFALDQIPESFNVGLQGVLWRMRVMILGAIALLIYVFRRYVTRPLGEHWNHDDLALLVEKEYGELKDSLISTVQFERGNLPEHFNSPQLVKATIEKTVRDTESMNFTRGVRGSMAFMAFIMAFVCFGANGASAVVFDDAYGLFLQRVKAAILFGNPPMKAQQTFLEVTIRVKEKNSRLEREKIPVVEKDASGNTKICVIPVPKGDSVTIKAVIDKRRSVLYPGVAYLARSTNDGEDYSQEDLMNSQNTTELNFTEESQAYLKESEVRLKTIASQFSGREKIPQRYSDERAELERNIAIVNIDLAKLEDAENLKDIQKYIDKDKIIANLKDLKLEIDKTLGECRASVDAMTSVQATAPASLEKTRAAINAFMDYRRSLEVLRNEIEEEGGSGGVFKQKKFMELAKLENVFVSALEARRAELAKHAPRGRQWRDIAFTLGVLPIRQDPEDKTGVAPQQRQVFFSNLITDVSTSFKFYISCGDSFKANISNDLSQHYEIRVIERPNTVNMNVYRVDPEYVDASQRSVRLEEGSDLSALLGTRVQVSTKANKPKSEVQKATLVYADSAGNVINTKPEENTMKWVEYYIVDEDGEENYVKKDDSPYSIEASKKSVRTEQWLEAEFTVTQTGRYWVELTDNFNYANIEHKVYEVIALKDKIPTMDVYYPDQRRLKLTRQASMPLRLTAKDDRNIKELVVRYQVGANTNPVEYFPIVPNGGIEIPSRADAKVKVLAPPDNTSSAQDQLAHSAVVIVGDDYKDGSRLNVPKWQMKSVGMYLGGDTKAKPGDTKEPAKTEAPKDAEQLDAEEGAIEEVSELDSEHRPLQVGDTIKYWVECADYYNGKENHTIKSKDFEIAIANNSEVQAIVEDGIRDLLKQANQARKDSEENYNKIDLAKQNLSGEGMEDEEESTEINDDPAKIEAEAKAKEDSRRQNVRAKIDAARIQVSTNVRLTEKIALQVKSLTDYIEMNQLPRMGEIPTILDFCATELKNINENYSEELVAKLKKSGIFDEDQEDNLNDAMDIQRTITDSLMTIESQLSNGVGMIALIVQAQKIEEQLDKKIKEMEDIRAPKKEEAPKAGEPVQKP